MVLIRLMEADLFFGVHPLEVAVHHHGHEFFKPDGWLPTQDGTCSGWVGDEQIHFGGTIEPFILHHVIVVVQIHMTERDLTELAHRMSFTHAYHEVIRLIML